jgi:DNA-binding NarL/FixJ family response regulator
VLNDVEHQAALVSAARRELPAGLSSREAEILGLIARGLTNAEIAHSLQRSPHTIDAHVRRIYQKLNVQSRSAATRFAVEHRLHEPAVSGVPRYDPVA